MFDTTFLEPPAASVNQNCVTEFALNEVELIELFWGGDFNASCRMMWQKSSCGARKNSEFELLTCSSLIILSLLLMNL